VGFLFLLCLFCSPLFAEKSRLSVEDVFQLKIASDPQISPSGNAVVYVRSFADSKTDKRYSNLWVATSRQAAKN
jgi:dipeptidyl aminopeptidase/acylaminoacyl peptidase